MTKSNGPNDVFPDVETTQNFTAIVGGVDYFFLEDNVEINEVASGPQLVTVPIEFLSPGGTPTYRVGSVTLTPSLTGEVTKCNAMGVDGNVTVNLDPAAANPSSASDYTVGIRIVNLDSEPLVGGVDQCGAPVGGGGGCPAR